jgi:iron-sulfur cluster assembly accessory protein
MIILTEKATKAVSRFIRGSATPNAALRLRITGGGCSGYSYEMALEEAPAVDDTIVEAGRFKVLIDAKSAPLLNGVTIDFKDTLAGSGFTFDNPNASGTCGCGTSFSA